MRHLKIDEIQVDPNVGRIYARHTGYDTEVIIRLAAVDAAVFVAPQLIGRAVGGGHDSDQELILGLRGGGEITLTADPGETVDAAPGTLLLWNAWDSIERIWRGEIRAQVTDDWTRVAR